MKNIIEENYKRTVTRGLITPSTLRKSFIDKLIEEVKEFTDEYEKGWLIDKEELADIILVCLNISKHYIFLNLLDKHLMVSYQESLRKVFL